MAVQNTQATGTLGGTPVANLLIYVLDHRLTGTLVLEDPAQRKSAVAFVGGAPTKVRIPEPVAFLSDVLVDLEALDPEGASSTFESARAEQRLHGRVLVSQGLIEEQILADALAEQVALKIEWMCSLPPDTRFGYYDGKDFLQNYGAHGEAGTGGAMVEPLGVIWRALRLQADSVVVDATLRRLGDRDVRLHPKSRVGRFGFTPRERGVVDVLRARPQPLPSLIASELLPENQLRKILYALVVTRHIDLGGDAGPIGVWASGSMSTSPPTSAPTSMSTSMPAVSAPPPSNSFRRSVTPGAGTTPPPVDSAAFRRELAELRETVEKKTLYEILGVDDRASPSVIQASFFQLAKRWHPDRLSPDLVDVRDQSVRIFARMSEAHRTLSNDDLRREYDEHLRTGETSEEQAIVERVLGAANNFHKAEMFAKRGNNAEAEKYAALAMQADPEQAEYAALYADILSQHPDRAATGIFTEVLKIVNDAKKLQPDNLRVRLYRARVLKRSGEALAAHREFRAIVEQDANNVEAAREVRLFEMRRGKGTTGPKRSTSSAKMPASRTPEKGTPSDIGQLFGKFFKR